MRTLTLLLLLPVLIACNNTDKSGSLFSRKPCDVYVGEWTGTTTLNGAMPENKITIIVSANGDNYLMEGVKPETGERGGMQGGLICENGLLTANGIVNMTYVKDGDYCLIFGDKFFRNGPVKNNHANGSGETEMENVDDESPSCVSSKHAVLIEGDGVRLRSEPDVTKENVIMKFDKGTELVYVGVKEIDGVKWYTACYNGNVGWVSSQFSKLKPANMAIKSGTGTDPYAGKWEGNGMFVTIQRLDAGYQVQYSFESDAVYAGKFQLVNGVLKGKTSNQFYPNNYSESTFVLSADQRSLIYEDAGAKQKTTLQRNAKQ